MQYQAKITIALKEGMLDPEARAIQHALANLGYQTDALTSAKTLLYPVRRKGEERGRRDGRQNVRAAACKPGDTPVHHRGQ